MKRFVAIYILCLLFLPLHGQEVFGYYRSSSSNILNSHWRRIPQNDTALAVSKQKGRLYTKYVMLYHDIKVKFKIENDVVLQLDSIGVCVEKLPPPHYVKFCVFPSNSYWGIGFGVPGAIHDKSIQIYIFPKPGVENFPWESHHIALRTTKRHNRVYVYDEIKGKFIRVSREKAIRMVEEKNHPQQP
ncbi:MAG: hypothetical protein IKU03_04285 [Bacteroidales bacterium]|nr:hypothetical protein [Bacteroidales bacterium]